MPRRTTHITQKLKAAATLLFLLLCVCSAVARDTTRVFSKLPWDANTAGGANGLGGAYTNEYNYDGLYRLTSANGTYSGNNTSYSLEMSYTPAGRLCSKLQDFTATANTYAYSPNNKPHAVRRIYNGLTNELYNLRWDNNGNLAQQTVYSVNNNVPTFLNMRMLFWDEGDRLNLVAGDGYLSYYAYGHDGNRAIKMTGNAAIDQTGTLLNYTNLENITIYPNEYLTVTQSEYTKYYYANGTRIASKIGTGGFEKMQRLCTEDLNISGNANTLFGNALQQIVNITNQPNDEFPVDVCGGYSVSAELLTNPLPDFYISQTNLNFTQNNLLQQFRQNLTNAVEPVYYFHSDHLGSASWITNNAGLPVQHLQYLPFGEHFVNEQSTGYFERFTFTGKERDAETGYYYHGARFNSSDLGWLSVDPMSDKYPSLTPYNYCAWNPVKLVDPEGKSTQVLDNGDGTYKVVGGNVKDGDNGIYLQKLDGSNGKLIAYSATPESFYNSDNGKFMGTINPKDNSGRKFLNEKIVNSTLLEYMFRALPKKTFDFKRTNGTEKVIFTKDEDFYRGMHIGEERGLPIWASARDVGNIAAGYIAGRYGFSWSSARVCFDLLESLQNKKLSKETSSTVYAQRLGYNIGVAIYQMMMIKELSRLPSYGSDIYRNAVPIPNTIIKKL